MESKCFARSKCQPQSVSAKVNFQMVESGLRIIKVIKLMIES
jgi:hypothetical protein